MGEHDVMVVHESRPPMSPEDLKANMTAIQTIMKEVMKDGEHYGVIPGTGGKPSLLKAGAEKLMLTFRLVPEPHVEVVDLFNANIPGHREYRVMVKLYNMNGIFLGAGVGSCSTMEAKYRFRTGPKKSTGKPVPGEYWNLRKSDPAKALEIIGGKGHGVMKDDAEQWVICEVGERVEHDNPADYYNTCEKMAKKRALVDATLTVTAASDIFTQDVEEMVTEPAKVEGAAEPEKHEKAPIHKPQEGQEPKHITGPQASRFYAIFHKAIPGDSVDAHDWLKEHFKIQKASEIPANIYNDVIGALEKLGGKK